MRLRAPSPRLLVGSALALLALIGCQQRCFLSEGDFEHYHSLGLPCSDCDNSPQIEPMPPDSMPPATVSFPERPARHIALSEALALALETGIVGNPTVLQGDPYGDNGVFFNNTSKSLQGANAVRVLALQPAIAATDVEASLSKFDARWQTNVSWITTDRPIATFQESFLTLLPGGSPNLQLQDAVVRTGLVKPLATGGVAGITFNTNYELANQFAVFNPAYQPALRFSFEQPLLQGYGVEINQLRAFHPNSLLAPLNSLGAPVEGILITRLNFDQQRIEFERGMQQLVLNVETAYWNLYSAYWTLYSRDQALRQAFEAWRINRIRYEQGKSDVEDLTLARGQYELFRSQRLAALGGPGGVLERERQLRGLLGMPGNDGQRLIPADTPTVAPFEPDWNIALAEAWMHKPELVLARTELNIKHLKLVREKNQLLPDLRLTSTYDVNSASNRLDGSNGAFSRLGDLDYNNWSIGLNMEVPLGFRRAHAGVRSARLELARGYAVLREQEVKTQLLLEKQYRNLSFYYELIKTRRAQREANGRQVEARFQKYLEGRGTLNFLLDAQRTWADALGQEYEAVSEYNKALAAFEFAKGTILNYDNVVIGEGPLPACAQVRAVEHEQRRSQALVVKERDRALLYEPVCCEPGAYHAGLPDLPAGEAPSLPMVLTHQPLVPEISEASPGPVRLPGGRGAEIVPVGYHEPLARPLAPNLPTTAPLETFPAEGSIEMEVPGALPPLPELD